MTVNAKYLEASGLQNPFTNKKKWRITCGNCEHRWDEKVPIGEPSSAICPYCKELNMWSYNYFAEQYEKDIENWDK